MKVKRYDDIGSSNNSVGAEMELLNEVVRVCTQQTGIGRSGSERANCLLLMINQMGEVTPQSNYV